MMILVEFPSKSIPMSPSSTMEQHIRSMSDSDIEVEINFAMKLPRLDDKSESWLLKLLVEQSNRKRKALR